jgi:uncharacterized protein YjbI with pentapeptide repeats
MVFADYTRVRSDLRGSDRCASDRCGNDLRESDLRESDLRESDLRASDLRASDLRASDLREEASDGRGRCRIAGAHRRGLRLFADDESRTGRGCDQKEP